MRCEQDIGRTRELDKVRSLRPVLRVCMGADIGIGPAKKVILTDAGEIIRHQIIAITVPFVHHHIKIIGSWIKGDTHGIAHPTGEGLSCAIHFVRARRCSLQDYFRIV